MLRFLAKVLMEIGSIGEGRKKQKYKPDPYGAWVNNNPDPKGDEDWEWVEKIAELPVYINVYQVNGGHIVTVEDQPNNWAVEHLKCKDMAEARIGVESISAALGVYGRVEIEIPDKVRKPQKAV